MSGVPLEYLIKQYPLETGALEIQYIEEYFGEFPRKKTAKEIIDRLRDRECLILMAEAPLPDDPGTIVPVSFKIVHQLRGSETEPKLTDLVARLRDCVRFDGRKVLYSWVGGTRRDWRGQGHFRALPRSPKPGRSRLDSTRLSSRRRIASTICGGRSINSSSM